jgi:hypothetical protein
MTDDPVVFHAGIRCYQGIDKYRQFDVLLLLEVSVIRPFEFYADREVVTGIPSLVAGCPGMPCAIVEGHELQNLAITTDQYMSRNLHSADIPKIRMCLGVETIGEQFPDMGPTELAGRQTDAMNDYQVGHNTLGPGIPIRRW